MDTSETYIKMCDCPEIQENRPEHGGDFFHEHGWFDCTPQIYCDCRKGEFDSRHFKTNYVWLPRQDQLQGMVAPESKETELYPIAKLLNGFFDFTKAYKFGEHAPTMEQLWLAFVMKEKHGKVWNGTEWKEEG
ncbi:hypothetical protein LCGC14_1432190 [marine sediment metagenome]|uniref:Uncharacterized protein n=1 Tax=marine sediment metagenome TaxID=412755 RepID=A0A0F9M3T7_9ZZZZ